MRLLPESIPWCVCVRVCVRVCVCVFAVLIDKDKSPAWKHTSVEEVSPALVESFFASIPEGATDLKLD